MIICVMLRLVIFSGRASYEADLETIHYSSAIRRRCAVCPGLDCGLLLWTGLCPATSLLHSYADTLTPNELVFGDNGFWEIISFRWGNVGRVPTIGLVPLGEETWERALFLFLSLHAYKKEVMWANQMEAAYCHGEGPQQKPSMLES